MRRVDDDQIGLGIELEETEHGLLVRQNDEAYIARNWRLRWRLRHTKGN
jgi:hypothetical protein